MSREQGTVVACFGRRVIVEDADGRQRPCLISGRRLRPVIGDRVLWEELDHPGQGLVCEICPRDNSLDRPDRRGKTEVLAANLTQLIVVVAPMPAPDPFLVDRYLAAAAFMGARGAVLLNKIDLADPSALDEARRSLCPLAQAGYTVLETSAKSGAGIEALQSLLDGQVSILVGQSGVGKSSLLNALLPDAGADTGELSQGSGEGRHVTTASRLFHLSRGGKLVDSPGVRDYAPAAFDQADLTPGFMEFVEPAAQCKFSNCRHLHEPGCSVRAAVEEGRIHPRRYESYKRLARLMDRLRPGY